MQFNKKYVLSNLKDCVMIMVGLVLYAIGFCGFVLPKGVVIGGMAGLASLIYFQTNIPVWIPFYVLNITLLAIAYKVVGAQFVLKTIFGASFLSLFIGIAQPFFEAYPVALPETFLDCVIGAVLCGTGVGIAFTHNGSTGGTDIVAAMVSKYHQVSVGRMILYVDLIIISSSFIIYHDLNKVIYGYVVLVFLSYMADQVVNNTRQAVQFTIFSKRWDEIATAVNNELHRGCTIIDGTGWYTRQGVKMLLIYCRKSEALDIYRLIKELDPHAFMSQSNVTTVYGEGFDENKVKARRRIDKQRKLQEQEQGKR
ncbi:MAG: YitT family protein [Candidatus Limisoma sp.]